MMMTLAALARSVGRSAVTALVLVAACVALFASRTAAETLVTDTAVPERIQPYEDGAWPTGDLRDYGYEPVRLDSAIEEIGKLDGLYGVLVVRQGKLLAERYFREASRTKAHNLKSSSKSIVSTLVGLLVADGLLSLDESVVERLGVKGVPDDRDSISVRDLLRMASGLTSTSYESYGAWIAGSDWVRGALALPLLYEPGTRYRYSTGNTHLLSALVAKASGISTRRFAEERLFAPLGVEVLGWETDPKGVHIGGNNLALLPRDMARFGELFLRNGTWAGHQLVPEAWVREATGAQIAADHEIYGDYGYQWFVPNKVGFSGDFIAVGYGGQYIYVAPRIDTVVVITSTLESKGRTWERDLFALLEQEILQSGTSLNSQIQLTSLDPAGVSPVPLATGDLAAESLSSTEVDQEQESELELLKGSAAATRKTLSLRDTQLANLRSQHRVQRGEWTAERSRLTSEIAGQRDSQSETEGKLREIQSVVDNLRRREELNLEDFEAQRAELSQRILGASQSQVELSQQLKEASSKIATLTTESEGFRLDLERSKAAQRRIVQQAESERQRIESSGADAQKTLAQAYSVEREQQGKQFATEQARADQALRELEKTRNAASVADARAAAAESGRKDAVARVDELSQTLALRSQRLAALQEEVEALRNETVSLRNSKGRADTELSKTKDSLRVATSSAVELKQELGQRDVELVASETALASATERVVGLTVQVDSLTQERNDYRVGNEAGNKERAGLASASEALRQEREELRQKLGLAENELESARLQLRTSDDSGSVLAERAVAAQATSMALRSELLSTRGQLSEAGELQRALQSQLEEEQEQASNSIQRLRTELVQARSEIDSSSRSRADQQKAVDSAMTELRERAKSLQTQLGAQEEETAKWLVQREATVDESDRLRSELSLIKVALTEAENSQQQQLARSATEKNAATLALAESTVELDSALLRIEQLRSTLEEGTKHSKARSDELGRDLAATDEQLSDRTAALASAQQEIQELEATKASQARQLKLAREQQARFLAEAGTRLAVAEEAEQAASEQDRTDREVEELMQRLSRREESIKTLQRELRESKDNAEEVSELRESYQRLVGETEMLARRSADQAELLNQLQRRNRDLSEQEVSKRLSKLVEEVNRLMTDRRTNATVRQDLAKLRNALLALSRGL